MNPQILVVDDYAFNRLIYRDWLRELTNVDIVEADCGERALQLAASHPFALCVVDVRLPDLSGFAVTSRLRAMPLHQYTPIILVTSEAIDTSHQLRAYDVGAVDYVTNAVTRGATLSRKASLFIDLWRQREALVAELADMKRRLAEADLVRDKLRMEASSDPLTRLPNRTLFRDRLQAASQRAARSKTMFGVGYIDLDDFKAVNDEHGHAAGDALLRAVALRLTRALRATDTVARLGGDEFGLLFESIDGPFRAEAIAEKLHGILCQGYELSVPGVARAIRAKLGASIGLAVYPDHAVDADRLLFRADMSMYAAKHGGGGVRMFGADVATNDALISEVRTSRLPAQRWQHH